MNEEGKKDREKLTTGPQNDDNQTTSAKATLSGTDPRIIAVVEFLARRAAERDFAQLIERLRRDDDRDDGKGRIQ